MALAAYVIRRIDYATAMVVVVREHYLHRRAPCSIAFGLFLGDALKGVICYGTPSSAPLRSGIAGPEYAKDVVELTRLWVCDSVPRNGESMLIGRTLARAGKHIVVSFADVPASGTSGQSIRQATGSTPGCRRSGPTGQSPGILVTVRPLRTGSRRPRSAPGTALRLPCNRDHESTDICTSARKAQGARRS